MSPPRSACAARCCSTAPAQKMGKSEKGAVFLDGELTSPYDFYQYWINDDDEVVRRPSALADHDVARRDRGHRRGARQPAPEQRLAQKAIAYDLTARIHGADEAERQVVVAAAAFATEVDDPAVLAVLYDAVGGFEFGAEAEQWTAIDIAVAAGGSSKGEARGSSARVASESTASS